MTPLMNPLASADEHLWSLTQSMCDGTITEEERDRLDALLRGSDRARLFYAAYIDLHGRMLWRFRGGKGDAPPAGTRQETVVPPADPIMSNMLVSVPTTSLRGTFGILSSGWPAAYLVATVIVGIGLVIGSLMPASRVEQLDPHSPQIATETAMPSPRTESVGRITGMIDCEWANSSTAAAHGAYVPLGRKYALKSGLLEITYDTGAKVLLQGPAAYEVESNNGGFLADGRLNGKATTQRAHGLTVRTPAATVVDIGTEFGVEVSGRNSTKTYVISGAVNIVGHRDGATKTVTAGETLHIQSGVMGKVERGMPPKDFVRAIPTLPPSPSPSLPRTLTDNFNDNAIDWTKWRLHLLPFGGSRVVEEEGRIELTNRGHLITRSQFPPDMLGGIAITGRWTVAKKPGTAWQSDILQILTRSNGIPDPRDDFGETGVGLEFAMDYGFSDESRAAKRVVIRTRGDLAITNLTQAGEVVIHEGGNYDFRIVDRGPSGLSFTLTEAGDPANSASATAVLDFDHAGYGHIVFHNGQKEGGDNIDQGNHVAYLDDVAITSAEPKQPHSRTIPQTSLLKGPVADKHEN